MSHWPSAVLLKPRPHVKYLINRSNTQQFLVQLQVNRGPPSAQCTSWIDQNILQDAHGL